MGTDKSSPRAARTSQAPPSPRTYPSPDGAVRPVATPPAPCVSLLCGRVQGALAGDVRSFSPKFPRGLKKRSASDDRARQAAGRFAVCSTSGAHRPVINNPAADRRCRTAGSAALHAWERAAAPTHPPAHPAHRFQNQISDIRWTTVSQARLATLTHGRASRQRDRDRASDRAGPARHMVAAPTRTGARVRQAPPAAVLSPASQVCPVHPPRRPARCRLLLSLFPRPLPSLAGARALRALTLVPLHSASQRSTLLYLRASGRHAHLTPGHRHSTPLSRVRPHPPGSPAWRA